MKAAALRPARLSLRARLLAITLALLTAGLVVSNILVTGALRGHLVKRVDEQVTPLATAFSRLPPGLLSPDRDTTFPKGLTGRTDLLSDLYVAHLTQAGDTDSVLRSPESANPAGPALPRLDERAVAAHGGRPFEVAGRGGGERWRVIALRHVAGGSVVVAASLHGVNATIGRLRADCVLIGAAVLALLGAAGWFAVRAGLRPPPLDQQETRDDVAGDHEEQIDPEEAAGHADSEMEGDHTGHRDRAETVDGADPSVGGRPVSTWRGLAHPGRSDHSGPPRVATHAQSFSQR
jgi:two-component system OmpR family sensor kinase